MALSEAQFATETYVRPALSRNGVADADSNEAPAILVSDTPPTALQLRLAWGGLTFLGAVFVVTIPFFYVQLGILPAFVPVVHAVVCLTGFIAAAFLFSQYAVEPRPAFLALAGGYMLAGLFCFFQSLAFPHSYSTTGVLGGGPSVAGWLFLLWRTTFAVSVLAYALIERSTNGAVDRPAIVPIAITTAIAVIGACSITWIVTAAQPYLPLLFTDATHESRIAPYTVVVPAGFSIAAILLLSTRRSTILNLWLIVTLAVALPDVILPVTRFMLGFYVARGYELISSCAVLIALLTEASTLYARLASARALQRHEETERLTRVQATVASIAHELRQPLNAIRINAHTGAMIVAAQKSDSWSVLGEILSDIEKDISLADSVLEHVRTFVRRQRHIADTLDINEAASDAVKLVSGDAASRGVAVEMNLSGEKPLLTGDLTQITQVLVNLLANGMNAMEAVPAAQRRLILQTSKQDGVVVVSVRDCGHGISAENMTHLFEPFYTTRSGGMGLGLYISQSIVSAHRGRMWAENNKDQGATFYLSLPADPAERSQPKRDR